MTDYTPPPRKPDFTGRLVRREDGTLLLVCTDLLGWRTTFVCTRSEGGYDAKGWVGEVPGQWHVPGLDD